MIVVVLVHSQQALDILLWASQTRPELYRVTSGHLALLAMDEVSEFVVFDAPMLELSRDKEYVRLFDLERGVERSVLVAHLGKALELKILENAF